MAKKNKKQTRACGVLLPIFSLPSEYGIGTFSKEAYEFVDFLKESGQSYWQILPLVQQVMGIHLISLFLRLPVIHIS